MDSLHIEGRTLEWFQEYKASNKEIKWGQFFIDVVSSFDLVVVTIRMGMQIIKLKYVSIVRAYQEQFKMLMVKTNGLSKEI